MISFGDISALSDEDLADLDLQQVRAEVHRRLRRAVAAQTIDQRAQERLTASEWAAEAKVTQRTAQRLAQRAGLGRTPTRAAWEAAKRGERL